MEEIEVPTEKVQEEINEHAQHAHPVRERWIASVALTSALLAVLAAVSALLGGDHANEAMIEQIQASDTWGNYQGKSTRMAVLTTKRDLMAALGKQLDEKAEKQFEEYTKDKEDLAEKAREQERAGQVHLSRHVRFARAVTMFQVAIGIAAISILTKRRRYFFVSIGFGLIGVAFLLFGLFFPVPS